MSRTVGLSSTLWPGPQGMAAEYRGKRVDQPRPVAPFGRVRAYRAMAEAELLAVAGPVFDAPTVALVKRSFAWSLHPCSQRPEITFVLRLYNTLSRNTLRFAPDQGPR